MKTSALILYMMRRRALFALAIAAGTAFAAPALGQVQGGYPNRQLRLMVGYSAGGGVDLAARLLAARLSTVLGQQIVVENRAGASGQIAADAVAKAPPDGYTLLMGESGMLIVKILQPKNTLDPLTSFSPVAGVFVSPLVIIAGNDFPAKTPAELVRQLKANPGRYSFATSGVGTVQHLGFEVLKQATGSVVVHVPYRGAAQIVTDVASGQVPLGVVSVTSAVAQANAGELRALALMNPGRVEGAESVAPLSDAVPGFNVAPRLFVLAPTGTPADVVGKLAAAVKNVLDQPETATAASAQGTAGAYLAPAALGKEMVEEAARWRRIVAEQQIVVEGN
ncbi:MULTISPECIES: tripartite tricarboxylate transporter substrate binding protein [unclassified Beijerinckia]|uniref:Bug family tripartite tricarboxylate transporter substrate binding protein n=1 Tax=unclassified Beijerinckia TaxID=2638183 RepID=UPI00089D61D0|nr:MULTISPECIES: tripartite tricarboxylate transporter substrate binding protein [unclassified Beijerinckia]MDH7795008.1 tripartite-type tricarboxylate transporter receptor subunit TctC [Beijerinckia sp. GAS462]SEB83888.1 Tripartite-type tricarboxylate transporter, receptor component TctC [Beijerinckia sp. 28-YEA-48]